MSDGFLFMLQRLSAVVLAPLVIVHLLVILWAVEGGLSGAEILERTRGSTTLALFYGLFVIAAAIHAPIGLRNVLQEWTAIDRRWLDPAMLGLAIILLLTGFRAVLAVTATGIAA